MSSLYDDALEDLGGLYTCNVELLSPSNFGLKNKEFKVLAPSYDVIHFLPNLAFDIA